MKKLKKVASVASPELDRILDNTPLVDVEYVAKTMAIADRIHAILEEKHLAQKDLAEMMDKSQAHVSKLVSGVHNLTMRTVFKMEELLGDEILAVPSIGIGDKARLRFRTKVIYKSRIATCSTPPTSRIFFNAQEIYAV